MSVSWNVVMKVWNSPQGDMRVSLKVVIDSALVIATLLLSILHSCGGSRTKLPINI